MNILYYLVLIPIATMITIVACKNRNQVRWVSAGGMFLELVLSVILLIVYLSERNAGNTAQMLFMSDHVWFKSLNIHLITGVDGISLAMILMTAVVVLTGIFISWEVEYLQKEFFIFVILLGTSAFGFFISLDLFTMFLFYEIAVFPMFLLIGIWGTGRKEYSAMKLTLMLMAGSALLLVGILGIYMNSNPNGGPLTFNILDIAKIHIPLKAQLFLFPLTFIGFGVHGALFPFHTWSPDGHSSAPTAVSMLAAGVLMKLGGYGCFRVAIFLLPQAAHQLAWIFIILTAISVVYGALGAIWQKDLKYINAYSSVSHVGIVLFALLMLDKTSMDGAILQMISHGFMTALFFAVIGMIYSRTHTRIISDMSGLMKVIPFISVLYVIAGLASLGLPGFSGFVAEMTIFTGAFQHHELFYRIATIMVCSSIVITAVYILKVVGKILFGPVTNDHYLNLPPIRWYEKLSGISLVALIAGMGIAPLWLSNTIMQSLQPIIERLF